MATNFGKAPNVRYICRNCDWTLARMLYPRRPKSAPFSVGAHTSRKSAWESCSDRCSGHGFARWLRTPISARGQQNQFLTSFWVSHENSPISDLTDALGMVLRAYSEKRNPIPARGHLGAILMGFIFRPHICENRASDLQDLSRYRISLKSQQKWK